MTEWGWKMREPVHYGTAGSRRGVAEKHREERKKRRKRERKTKEKRREGKGGGGGGRGEFSRGTGQIQQPTASHFSCAVPQWSRSLRRKACIDRTAVATELDNSMLRKDVFQAPDIANDKLFILYCFIRVFVCRDGENVHLLYGDLRGTQRLHQPCRCSVCLDRVGENMRSEKYTNCAN